MKDNQNILILTVMLILSMMLNLYLWLKPAKEIEKTVEIVKTDTIVDVVRDFDTIYIAKTKYKDVYKYDTLYKDSVVYLRDTVHNYQFIQPEYTLNIDAMKLVDYKLDIHARDTVTLTETHTVEKIIKEKKRFPIQIGLYGGMGYDINGKTFAPEVGIGVVVPLTKW